MLLILDCFTNPRMVLNGGLRGVFWLEELLRHAALQSSKSRASGAPIRARPYRYISGRDEKVLQRKWAPRVHGRFLILAQRHREHANPPTRGRRRVWPPA